LKPYSHINLITVLLLLTLSAGCDKMGIGGDQACTQIGCDDGINVQLSDERPDSLSLTIYLDDETEAFDSIVCTNQEPSCVLRTGGITPETVTVEIKWDTEEYRQTFTPEYESFQPNGPDCPPVCNIALLEIILTG